MLFLKIVRTAVFINSPLSYNKASNVSQSLGCEKALPAFQKVLSTMRLVLLPPSHCAAQFCLLATISSRQLPNISSENISIEELNFYVNFGHHKN